MYIPSQEQFQKVIDNLEKALVIAKGNSPVSMGVVSVETKEANVCGTPMCHGGWYAVACMPELMHKGEDFISYSDGAMLMADHLGFDTSLDEEQALEYWAEENPDIWGNSKGTMMFAAASAFGVDRVDLTMQIIIDHWKGVKERAANARRTAL